MKKGKLKGLSIVTIIFFLIVSTTFFWEGKMGTFVLIMYLVLITAFFVLAFLLLFQGYFAFKERFGNKQRLFLIGLMLAVLGLSVYRPNGIFKFESEAILLAQREGAANCMTTLKLMPNATFTERSVCFGITETTGNYHLKGDTIFFTDVALGRNENDYYQFAIFKSLRTKNEKYIGELRQYQDASDTMGVSLLVVKSELDK